VTLNHAIHPHRPGTRLLDIFLHGLSARIGPGVSTRLSSQHVSSHSTVCLDYCIQLGTLLDDGQGY